MRGTPEPGAEGTLYTHAPAANTQAIITVAAVAEHRHVLDWVHYSWDQAPAAGRGVLTICIDVGISRFISYPTAAGPGFIEFPGGLYVAKNQHLCIDLREDNAGASGKLTIKVR